MSIENLEYLQVDVQDHVAIITLDDPAEKVNVLNSKLSSDFETVFEYVANESLVKACVLISGKPGCFIAGADIKELKATKSESEAQSLSELGQKLLNKIEDNPKPVVAAIDGSCLGGGMEVALACHYRIASDSSKTVLALPEVMLGLLPGAGGTQRLPKLIGLQKALDMMLTGKNIKAKRALKMGLVDYVVSPEGLKATAIKAAKELASGHLSSKDRKKSTTDKVLEDTSPGQGLVFKKAREEVLKKSQGLYPAPLAIIDVVKEGFEKGIIKGYQAEAKRFGELSQGPECRGLISLFDGQTELKKNPYPKTEKKTQTIGILGAGLMGAGIGLVSVQKGYQVKLKDINQEGLGRGKKYIYDALNSRVKKKAMSKFDRDKTLASLHLQDNFKHFEKCDIIIEAVFEDLSLKHRVIKEVEDVIREDCVFASNTSGLPLTKIAEVSKRPENVLGMHYFSPVQKMPLLEIIKTEKTSKETLSRAYDVGLKQGKTVIVVNDGPGFYTTRIIGPYSDEAAVLALEGMGFHDIDLALKKFGFPVGPITLMDEVGLDVGRHVATDLKAAFGSRISAADYSLLDRLIEKNILGRKSKKGFFLYDEPSKGGFSLSSIFKKGGGRPVNPEIMKIAKELGLDGNKKSTPSHEAAERVALRMINEAIYCLQDGVLESARDGDIGAVFGLGFPPFFGGPFRYVDFVGADTVVSKLNQFADKYGERFQPAQLLIDTAKSGKKFHPNS